MVDTSDTGGVGRAEVVEIVLGDESDVVEDGSVIDHSGTARWRPVGFALLMIFVAVLAWQVLAGGAESSEGSREGDEAGAVEQIEPGAPEDSAESTTSKAPPTTGPERSPPGPAEGVVRETEDVADEASVPQGRTELFPLFPNSPGLTLAIRVSDEVVLIDADSGAVSRISTEPPPSNTNFYGPTNLLLTMIGDSLVVQHRTGIALYPLAEGGSVELGVANAVWAHDDRLILGIFENEFRFRQFDEFGNEIGERLQLAVQQVWPSQSGLLSGPGGIYEVGLDGFRRLSRDALLVSGQNHMLTLHCDESLECGHNLVELSSGAVRPIGAVIDGQFLDPWNASLSPDGRFLEYLDHRLGKRNILNLETGETVDGGAFSDSPNGGPAPRVWTPDSGYLIELSRGQLLIVESATGERTSIEATDLGIDDRIRAVLVFERPGQ